MQSVKKWAPLLALALVAMNGGTLRAEAPYVYQPVPQDRFTAVPEPTTAPQTHPHIGLLADEAQPLPAPFATPEPTPPRRERAAPTAQPAFASTGSSIEGTATFYCNHDASRGPLSRCSGGLPGGLYAAISPDLLWLRGRQVQVCYESTCVVVRVADCNCQANQSIDLYADAFVQLAPLSRGRIPVTISW